MNAARDQSATGIIGKMTDTRKRVKLYELNADRQWDDKGTGGIVFLFLSWYGFRILSVRNFLTSLLKNLYCGCFAYLFSMLDKMFMIKITKICHHLDPDPRQRTRS